MTTEQRFEKGNIIDTDMPAERTQALTDIEIRPDSTHNVVMPVRRWVASAWDGGNRWIRSPLVRIRPRVSLLTGSTLVLLTLYVPFAYESCDPNRTGNEFIRGEGSWPGFLSFLDLDKVGRGLYIFTLGTAAMGLLLLLMSLFRRKVLGEWRLIRGQYAIAGALSLFLAADSFGLCIAVGTDAQILALFAITLSVAVWCLRAHFLRRQRLIALLFGVYGVLSLLVIAAVCLPSLPLVRGIEGNLPDALMRGLMGVVPYTIYWLVPLGLWYRFGLSRRSEIRLRWPTIRHSIVLLYLPAVLAQLLHFGLAVQAGVWGVVPYWVGVHLMSLGYMQLVRQADPATCAIQGKGKSMKA